MDTIFELWTSNMDTTFELQSSNMVSIFEVQTSNVVSIFEVQSSNVVSIFELHRSTAGTDVEVRSSNTECRLGPRSYMPRSRGTFWISSLCFGFAFWSSQYMRCHHCSNVQLHIWNPHSNVWICASCYDHWNHLNDTCCPTCRSVPRNHTSRYLDHTPQVWHLSLFPVREWLTCELFSCSSVCMAASHHARILNTLRTRTHISPIAYTLELSKASVKHLSPTRTSGRCPQTHVWSNGCGVYWLRVGSYWFWLVTLVRTRSGIHWGSFWRHCWDHCWTSLRSFHDQFRSNLK